MTVSIHALTRSATPPVVRFLSVVRVFQSTHSRGVRQEFNSGEMYGKSFNPRTHEECDSSGKPITLSTSGFNPRTHEECDFTDLCSKSDLASFNPRTHEECDKYTMFFSFKIDSFNPRTHEECDQLFMKRLRYYVGFNPRTHEECDSDCKTPDLCKEVSIHALTRSATHPLSLLIFPYIVSIHALTRSATTYNRHHTLIFWFQSTHSRGVRHSCLSSFALPRSFNPRTHEECDK